MNQPSQRRIFIKKDNKYFQLFSFSQGKDGSIYCSSPDFQETKWVTYIIKRDGPKLVIADSPGPGKLSIHGTGMTKIRAHDKPVGHTLIIKGNYLLNLEKNQIGIRHLFTAFLRQLKYLPNTPAFSRKSDYSIIGGTIKPFVIIFYAVPQHKEGMKVQFSINFQIDEMENIPNDVLGMNGFGLRYHDVFWFAYRTKNMDKWPKHTYICYDNGYTFPIFIGTGIGSFRLEFRQPEYILNENELWIQCQDKFYSTEKIH